MSADVVIMAVNALEGWTPEDSELLEIINCNKVMSYPSFYLRLIH